MGRRASNNENVWWIEDEGRWLNFGDEYASRFPECYFINIEHRHGPAFEMLGMVKMTSYARIIDFQWDVRHVTQGALASMLDYLLSLESPGNNGVVVALKFYFGAWNTEVYQSPGSALQRIIELSEYAHAKPNDSITIASIDLKQIKQSHTRIHNCFDKWEAMNGVLDQEGTYDLGELYDRSLVTGLSTLQERVVYKAVGAHSLASEILGSDWRYSVLGRPIEQCYSDDGYEKEVCSDYPAVMKSGEPRLDHIRAYYHLDNDDPLWLNYERLLLPWKTPSGEPLVMCLSQQSQNLSVPFLEAAVDLAA